MNTGSANLESTADLLAEAAQLCAEATPGPWHDQFDGWTVRTTEPGDHGPSVRVARTDHSGEPVEREAANARFIAFAREAIPALIVAATNPLDCPACSRAEKAEADNARLRDELAAERTAHTATKERLKMGFFQEEIPTAGGT